MGSAGGAGRSKSWGTLHTWGSPAALGTSWSPEAGAFPGNSLTTRVLLSFGKAWWHRSPAGVGLRAACVMELPPQGHCMPFPLSPCLPCSCPWLSRVAPSQHSCPKHHHPGGPGQHPLPSVGSGQRGIVRKWFSSPL